MKLVVDNDNGVPESEDVTMTIGETAMKEIILNAMWEQNPWLRKFNTCFVDLHGKSITLTFGSYMQPDDIS